MTGIDRYTEQGKGKQKQTHLTFLNIDNPEVDGNYADSETMREHYRAAKALKSSQIDRRLIVGDFMVAVEKELVQGKEGAIEEFLQELSE